MNYKLSTHGLYILSGAPAAGKSTWVKNAVNLPESALFSTDKFREQIYGARPVASSDGDYFVRYGGGDKLVFETVAQFVRARLQQKMLTVVDATNTTNKDRAFWARIADECGVPTTVLLFDVPKEELLARDAKRQFPVGEKAITHFVNKLERKSPLPMIRVENNDTFTFAPPSLPHNRFDILGDTHGLLDDLLTVTSSLGYKLERNLLTHPENRKILFLGDWLDRGAQSLECLELVYQNCAKGGHLAVIGNHEFKILKAYQTFRNENVMRPLPFSSSETMTRLIQGVPQKRLDELMNWMGRLPYMYQHDRFMFCHADVRSLDPFNMPGQILLFGESDWGKIDSDADFSRWSLKQPNQPILIRGHIPPTSPNATHAFSMERKVGFKGVMMAMRLDTAMEALNQGMTPAEAVHGSTISLQTTFDFADHQEKKASLQRGMNDLAETPLVSLVREKKYGMTMYKEGEVEMSQTVLDEIKKLEDQKLITHKKDASGLAIYKYARRVFFDGLWGEHDLLLHARGLVLDPAGNIVQNPFIKVFNYGERDTGSTIPDHQPVEAIEKMNGFLGCVTKHPFEPNKLLVTTTGSFDSDFVQYIYDFITPQKERDLLDYLDKNDQTLMFEVVHPEDPHIIHYPPEQHGLYLIGARGKESLTAPQMSERDLDVLGKTLDIKRPKHYKTTFGSLRDRVARVQHEGYMVRDLASGETLLKFKTGHYLTVKFLGRMGQGQIKMLFENPQVFKQKVDEEYYPLVDLLIQKSNFQEFGGMKPEDRVPYVRQLVEEMWGNIKQVPAQKRPTLK
jgi:predicted kinase